jgi:PKD repeat protein
MVKSSIAQTRSRHRASWGGLIALAALLVPASPAGAASNGFASLKVVAESSTTPTALIDTAGSLVCGTAALSGAGGELSQYPDSYTLDFGDGVHVSGNAGTSTCDEPALPPSIEHVYDAAGTYTVTMTVVSHVCSINCGPGEPDTVSASVTVPGQAQALPSPQANLDPLGPVIGGAPYALAFGQASFAPPGAQLVEELYRWGDGTSTILSPVLGQFVPQAHTYKHPGTYLTTLRVRTNQDMTDVDSEIITVSKAPTGFVNPTGNVTTATKTLTASAFLFRSDENTPEAGKLVSFYTANNVFVCGGYTDGGGYLSCTGGLGANITITENKGFYAVFAGDYDTVGVVSPLKKPTVNAKNTSTTRAQPAARVTISPLADPLGALSLRRVRGTASANAARVMVTVERSAGGSCRIVGGGKVRAVRSNCRPAGFRQASGTRRWSLQLGPLRAGSYQVYAYPVNAAGRPGSIAGTSFQVQ